MERLFSGGGHVLGQISIRFLAMFCLVMLSASVQAEANPGLVLQATRVIYPSSATGGVIFSVTNNTTAPYLMQSRIRDREVDVESDTDTPGPFIVLPPLHRLEPGEKLTLRIRLMNAYLRQDQESLFTLSLKAIPALPDTGGALMVAMQNHLKLFYRPKGLPAYGTEGVAKRLRFQRQGQQLQVSNPTPYWVTFNSLTLGGNALSTEQMVPPFGHQVFPLSGVGTSNELTWQLINEHGAPTNLHRKMLSPG